MQAKTKHALHYSAIKKVEAAAYLVLTVSLLTGAGYYPAIAIEFGNISDAPMAVLMTLAGVVFVSFCRFEAHSFANYSLTGAVLVESLFGKSVEVDLSQPFEVSCYAGFIRLQANPPHPKSWAVVTQGPARVVVQPSAVAPADAVSLRELRNLIMK